MSNYLPLYFRLISSRIRSQMQYRVSFSAELLGTVLITGLDFAMVAILLTRFRAIGGWTLAEVAFLYGTSAVSFSVAELLIGGFEDFEDWVVRGEFDQLLLRPLPITFQMITARFPTRRFGRLAQGLVALALSLVLLRPAWSMAQVLFFPVMLVAGAILFMAVFVAGATSSFWAPQAHEAINIFSYGGQFMTSYPMHIYQEWLVSIFTFIIPMAFINYYPALYLLDKPDPFGLPAFIPFLSPIVAVIAFRLSLALWRVGVRHYQGTGT
ncbi:MAG: ABC transporter permease [Nitrososphaerales archaeon]